MTRTKPLNRDIPGYFAVHDWIKRHYGKASKCEDCGTKETSRYHWANISGKYLKDVNDFKKLCPSCHKKMDRDDFCKAGHSLTDPENVYNHSKGWRGCLTCRVESRKRYRSGKENLKAEIIMEMRKAIRPMTLAQADHAMSNIINKIQSL